MSSGSRSRRRARRAAVAVLGAAGALVAWQIVVQAAADRLPAAAALTLAPGSARLLAASAEAEFEADRVDAAESLAARALAAEPLNVRALRVLGVAAERRGHGRRADDLVTLAGNWSLRDGPAHAWLVERRLRQGDYASAFAHADALMRRSADVQPQLFRLMAASIAEDRRALAPIAERLSWRPAWRGDFLRRLAAAPGGLESVASLGVMLEPGPAPFSDEELGDVLTRLVGAGQFKAAADLRRRLAPPVAAEPFDGGFDDRPGPAPFRWLIEAGAGAAVEFAPDEARAGQSALRVEYDGYSAAGLVRQFMALPAGAYELRARWRGDTPIPEGRLAWALACAEDGRVIARAPLAGAAAETPWRPSAIRFEVPDSGCDGQWLQLAPLPGERRVTLVVWYDDLAVVRVS